MDGKRREGLFLGKATQRKGRTRRGHFKKGSEFCRAKHFLKRSGRGKNRKWGGGKGSEGREEGGGEGRDGVKGGTGGGGGAGSEGGSDLGGLAKKGNLRAWEDRSEDGGGAEKIN